MKKSKLKNLLFVWLASGFGLGLSPVFPGTFGALCGVGIHLAIVGGFSANFHLALLILAFIGVCLANHLLTPWAENYWQCQDPKHFVLDEVAGYLLIPILFPNGQLWKTIGIGFILFRILDITKCMPPAAYVDKHIHGSWGILLDDLISAAYAVGIMYMIRWIAPSLI